MKKIFLFMIICLIIFPTLNALELKIEKLSENEVMIVGVDDPVVFDLRITNYGPKDSLEFYNLLGFNMKPVGRVPINASETQDIKLYVSPIGDFNYMGVYRFKYFIRGEKGDEIEETLSFKRINMDDAFEVGANSFDPESNTIEIYLHNKENFNFGEVTAKFSSAFFNIEETFNLGNRERKNFTIELDKEQFKQLLAGFYTMDVEVTADKAKTQFQGTLEFQEKNIVETINKDYGIIVSTAVIEKKNQGNVIAATEIKITKNIISRLFTSFTPDPDRVERSGLKVEYTWASQINPGESLEVTVKTNYLFPFIIILLIVAIVVLAKLYSRTNLSLKKQVTFVKAKGGEFALKVNIFVTAKNYIENVNIIDRLPRLAKLYERFGGEHPRKIDDKRRTIEWGFEKLEPGEKRVLSYIIYSKIGVLGKFSLPSAAGLYEKEGKLHETQSNRAFFVAEQNIKEDSEDY